jgi:archaellum component FlaG (FlaF/FlaG flagellin family)
LCLDLKGKLYDISNIEFKKNGDEQHLINNDSAKVLIEGKTILNKLIEEYSLDFEEAAKKKAVVAQICGNICSSEWSITISLKCNSFRS